MILRPFIRYPGGKSRHTSKIIRYFTGVTEEYREPFVGGGSVFLASIDLFKNTWINDIDAGIFDLWRLVKEEPEILIELIKRHTPILDHKKDKSKIPSALELWRKIKSDEDGGVVPIGYRSLFLSRTCFSGVLSGGPTGGLKQTVDYDLMSRWAADFTISRINLAHQRMRETKVTNFSWEQLVQDNNQSAVLFLDPPYLKKGSMCYKYYFTLNDHEKLAETVYNSVCRFVVTVDDVPEVRKIWRDVGIPDECLIKENWLYSMSDYRDSNKEGNELFIVDEQTYEICGSGKKDMEDIYND